MIRLSTEIHENAEAAIAALASDEELFHRDGSLVHVVHLDADVDGAIAWTRGAPQVRQLAPATLRERLTRAAQWERWDGRSKDYVPTVPSSMVAGAVHARGEWPGLRPLVGILEAPSFRADGSRITTPGYDAASGYLYAPNDEFRDVSRSELTPTGARHAFDELAETFCDFPHRSDAGLEVAIAAVLTLLARPMIQGSTPAFVFDASTRGSGKSLQTDAIALIATGRGAARMNWPPSEEELEKCLAAYALRAATLVSFDNISRAFCGAPLDRCITAVDRVDLRVLGKSEVPSLRWRAVIMGTGNNVSIDGDTARRVLVSRIEPDREDPENRAADEFRHPNLLGWVKAERPRLVRAAMTMIAAWVVAGRPQVAPGAWGSFEAWAAIVPQAIAYSGGCNVLAARVSREQGHDSEASALVAVLDAIERIGGGTGITSRGLVSALYPVRDRGGPHPPDGFDDARAALETLVRTKPGLAPSAKDVGKALGKHKGRIVAGMKLEDREGHAGSRAWRVGRLGRLGRFDSNHIRARRPDISQVHRENEASEGSQASNDGGQS
jgi:hypothetical protein